MISNFYLIRQCFWEFFSYKHTKKSAICTKNASFVILCFYELIIIPSTPTIQTPTLLHPKRGLSIVPLNKRPPNPYRGKIIIFLSRKFLENLPSLTWVLHKWIKLGFNKNNIFLEIFWRNAWYIREIKVTEFWKQLLISTVFTKSLHVMFIFQILIGNYFSLILTCLIHKFF